MGWREEILRKKRDREKVGEMQGGYLNFPEELKERKGFEFQRGKKNGGS